MFELRFFVQKIFDSLYDEGVVAMLRDKQKPVPVRHSQVFFTAWVYEELHSSSEKLKESTTTQWARRPATAEINIIWSSKKHNISPLSEKFGKSCSCAKTQLHVLSCAMLGQCCVYQVLGCAFVSTKLSFVC